MNRLAGGDPQAMQGQQGMPPQQGMAPEGAAPMGGMPMEQPMMAPTM